ncbi:MAG: MATE family efflux transporter [Clostridia bacterium]|nr:MATE family efflux transporter [Clostridia bacterium]
MENDREKKLASGPILKTMFRMGIPTFVAQLVNLLYNIVDRIYIGHIEGCGAAALTGVGVCFPVIMLITAFANLVGGGGAPLAGIALGKADRKKADKILGNSFTLLLILAVALTVIFQIIKRPFLYMFGASDATYAYGGEYLTVYLCGTVFVMISIGLNYYITVQGASLTAMLSVIIGAVINLILDPVFIFVFKMGVRGAAAATVISQSCSAAWILRFLTSKKATLRIKKSEMRLSGRIVGKITSLGVSAFIMGATESLISVVFNSGAQKYGGDLYVGSITVVQSVMQIICTPMNGFTQGVQPIISYNYGAKNYDRMKKTCLRLILITFSSAFVLSLTGILIPGAVAKLFTNDKELIDLCTRVMPVFICGMLVFGAQCGSQNCFLALGKAKQSLFFALFRKVILLTPLAIILPKALNSVMGLYYAEPISDITSAVCCFTVFMITLKKVMGEDKIKA